MTVVPSAEIHLEADGAVAVVTLDAPGLRNALVPAMADALVAAFDEVDARPEVGALVVRGEGATFCAAASTIAGLAADPGERTPTGSSARSTTRSPASAGCGCRRSRQCGVRPWLRG